MRKRFNYPQVQNELSREDETTERRLWVSVIEKAILDAKDLINKAAYQQKTKGCVNLHCKRAYQTVMNEINSDWFEEICSFVDLHPDRIRKFLKELEIKNEFFKLDFSEYEPIYH